MQKPLKIVTTSFIFVHRNDSPAILSYEEWGQYNGEDCNGEDRYMFSRLTLQDLNFIIKFMSDNNVKSCILPEDSYEPITFNVRYEKSESEYDAELQQYEAFLEQQNQAKKAAKLQKIKKLEGELNELKNSV